MYNVCLTVVNDSCGIDTYCREVEVCAPNVYLSEQGSLDLSFSEDGIVTNKLGGGSEVVSDMLIQPDGKIVTGMYGMYVSRYNPDGTLDSTFDGDGKSDISISTYYGAECIDITPSGKILVGDIYDQSDVGIVQLNEDGSFDTSFNGTGWTAINVSASNKQNTIYDIAALPDGKILQQEPIMRISLAS